MSLNISGEKCALCNAYLFEEDDVVYCPECGAPHHRECYAEVGHCALEQLHGTENQYQKPVKVKEKPAENKNSDDNHMVLCEMCGEKYSASEDICPNCNTPNFTKTNAKFIKIDLLGGVPSDMDLGDGVTANEAKMFVAANTQRYIPKFAGFKLGKKASWNWAAFLFPCAWFSSRKMYSKGAIIGTLQIVFSMLLLPMQQAMSYFDFSEAKNYFEMSEILMQNFDKIGTVAIVTAFVGILLNFILHIICGIFADFSYKNRVITAVGEIKGEDDKFSAYRRKGGVSLTAALIGIMAVEYLPSLFAMFIGI